MACHGAVDSTIRAHPRSGMLKLVAMSGHSEHVQCVFFSEDRVFDKQVTKSVIDELPLRAVRRVLV